MSTQFEQINKTITSNMPSKPNTKDADKKGSTKKDTPVAKPGDNKKPAGKKK